MKRIKMDNVFVCENISIQWSHQILSVVTPGIGASNIILVTLLVQRHIPIDIIIISICIILVILFIKLYLI